MHKVSTASNLQQTGEPMQLYRCVSFFPSNSGYCRNVFLYDLRDISKYYELKASGSTLWPTALSPIQLVPMFQILYNRCPPVINNAALCFPDCHWNGNANGFDIVIGTGIRLIITAYPAQHHHLDFF